MNQYDSVYRELSEIIVRVGAGKIRPEEVREGASLLDDLAMDSALLAGLTAEVRVRFGKVELTSWFASTTDRGADTVGALAAHIDRALAARKAL